MLTRMFHYVGGDACLGGYAGSKRFLWWLPLLLRGTLIFLLSYLPPLWFRVMNPRLLGLPHVAGDLSRVNR